MDYCFPKRFVQDIFKCLSSFTENVETSFQPLHSLIYSLRCTSLFFLCVCSCAFKPNTSPSSSCFSLSREFRRSYTFLFSCFHFYKAEVLTQRLFYIPMPNAFFRYLFKQIFSLVDSMTRRHVDFLPTLQETNTNFLL